MTTAAAAEIQSTNQDLWHDLDTDQFYLLKNGKAQRTDKMGHPTRKFVRHCSGEASYKDRVALGDQLVLPKLQAGSATVSSIVRLSGATQFPRPVCAALSNVKLEARNDNKRAKKILENMKYVNLRSTFNENPVKQRDYSVETCTYMRSSLGNFGMTTRNLKSMDVGYVTRTSINPNEFLRTHEKLKNSELKTKYLDQVKGTFRSCSNMNGLSSTAVKLLQMPETGDETSIPSSPMSYKEIQEKVKREAKEYQGLGQKETKVEKMQSRKIYDIPKVTQGDLYVKAKELRNTVNPTAFEEEKRREIIDETILKKRRKQRILKNMAMQTTIKAKEREVEKEILEKQESLMAEDRKKPWEKGGAQDKMQATSSSFKSQRKSSISKTQRLQLPSYA